MDAGKATQPKGAPPGPGAQAGRGRRRRKPSRGGGSPDAEPAAPAVGGRTHRRGGGRRAGGGSGSSGGRARAGRRGASPAGGVGMFGRRTAPASRGCQDTKLWQQPSSEPELQPAVASDSGTSSSGGAPGQNPGHTSIVAADSATSEAIVLQEEEIETLAAIYAEEELVIGGGPGQRELHVVIVPGADAEGISAAQLSLAVFLPPHYPAGVDGPPQFGLVGRLAAGLDEEHVEQELRKLWAEAEGAGVLWGWIEWLREFVEPFVTAAAIVSDDAIAATADAADSDLAVAAALAAEEQEQHEALLAAAHADHEQQQSDQGGQDAAALNAAAGVAHSEPLIDRKSVFQAHLCPCYSREDVDHFVSGLKQSSRKIASASHNIVAFRVQQQQQQQQQQRQGPSVGGSDAGLVLEQDFDDDGESAAGGRLLKLLVLVGALNVCVVVSRWFGGVHLGPDRFKDINNVARALLLQEGYVAGTPEAAASAAKHALLQKQAEQNKTAQRSSSQRGQRGGSGHHPGRKRQEQLGQWGLLLRRGTPSEGSGAPPPIVPFMDTAASAAVEAELAGARQRARLGADSNEWAEEECAGEPGTGQQPLHSSCCCLTVQLNGDGSFRLQQWHVADAGRAAADVGAASLLVTRTQAEGWVWSCGGGGGEQAGQGGAPLSLKCGTAMHTRLRVQSDNGAEEHRDAIAALLLQESLVDVTGSSDGSYSGASAGRVEAYLERRFGAALDGDQSAMPAGELEILPSILPVTSTTKDGAANDGSKADGGAGSWEGVVPTDIWARMHGMARVMGAEDM